MINPIFATPAPGQIGSNRCTTRPTSRDLTLSASPAKPKITPIIVTHPHGLAFGETRTPHRYGRPNCFNHPFRETRHPNAPK
jgi:hypothetical protein